MPGELIELQNGSSFAEIVTTGAYLKNLTLNGTRTLKPSGDGQDTHGGMALLLPFANRVRNAEYSWNGSTYYLPKNNGEHSIHGLTREIEWEIADQRNNFVKLSCKLVTKSYPVPLALEVSYTLPSDGFSVKIVAKNEGGHTAPFLAGMHPYFEFKDWWKLSGNRNLLELNYKDQYFPDGTFLVHTPESLGSHSPRGFDNTFLADEVVKMVSTDREVEISSSGMPYIVLFDGKYAEGISVAIEPMSGAPDAFNNGIGLISIPPGASFQCGAHFNLKKH